MKNKEEMTISLKLHIAPLQFNFLETTLEKKIYFDDDISEEEYNNKIKKTKEEVIDYCLESSIDCMEKANIPYDKKHLLSDFNKKYDKEKNVQEVNIDHINPNSDLNVVKNNNMPNIVIPKTEEPNTLDEIKNMGLFGGLFSNLSKDDNNNNNNNNQDIEDTSNDIDEGIMALEGDFHSKKD